MDLLPILSLLIFFETLAQEYVAPFDEDIESSSVSLIREKRMYRLRAIEPRTREPGHLWADVALNIYQDLRTIRIDNPTRVRIMEPRHSAEMPSAFFAFAIHPFLVVADYRTFRSIDDNIADYRVESHGLPNDPRWSVSSGIGHVEMEVNPDHDYVLIEVLKPILLRYPERNGLAMLPTHARTWVIQQAHAYISNRLDS